MQKTFKIHWLAITIWGTRRDALRLWGEWFEKQLLPMIDRGYGAPGFTSSFEAGVGVKLFCEPPEQGDSFQPYYHWCCRVRLAICYQRIIYASF